MPYFANYTHFEPHFLLQNAKINIPISLIYKVGIININMDPPFYILALVEIFSAPGWGKVSHP